MKFLNTVILLCGLSLSVNAQIVRMETVLGNIDIELRPDVAPATVANFLKYVNDGDYDNSYFHRSVRGFIIQGGGFNLIDDVFGSVPKDNPIVNEYNLPNIRGTISMAKPEIGGADTATSEWFFNLVNNTDALGPNNQNNAGSGGFTVFGSVIGGMDVIDAIAALSIWDAGGTHSNLPLNGYSGNGSFNSNLVIITRAYILDDTLNINPGLNGLWSDPSVDGQGFLLEYFPSLNDNNGGMFAAWFTHDSVSTSSATAELGDINQRWLSTNIGSVNHETNTISFELFSVTGGVFNTATAQALPRNMVGTMTMKFNDCSNAVVNYNLTTPVLTGSINVTRIVNDNVALCEILSRQVTTSR